MGEELFRITAAIPSLDWLEDMGFGMEVQIEDVSDDLGALALQGPTSLDLLQKISDADLASLKYFRMLETKVGGAPAWISRTGYTGDLGYEVFMNSQDAVTVWDALSDAGDAYDMRPAGMLALEMVRVEAGLLLIDRDFTSARQTLFDVQKSSPYELGLDWLVKEDKDFFVGQEALRREKAAGPVETTVGLVIDIGALERAYEHFGMPLHLPYSAWAEGVPVYSDDDRRNHIGKANSGTWSPILKQYIAIARVTRPHGALGSRMYVELTIETQRFAVPATVVQMPFFDPPRKRA
jgi:aminomethyltransferase